MPILPLLIEWSDREPEKCSYVGGMFAIRGWTLTHEYEITERLVNAEIQCAVQEAIEAHGWHWYLGRGAIEDDLYYKSRIVLPALEEEQERPKLNIFLSTHSPTHVLLQAYLQALKATRTGNPAQQEHPIMSLEDDDPAITSDAEERQEELVFAEQ